MKALVLLMIAANPWFGRWDLAAGDNGGWLEVAGSDAAPAVRIVRTSAE
jgi:hypothetical protein